MQNFVAYNPVKLFFGKGVTDKLGKNAVKIGKKAFLVYGKGSVVRNGIYDIVKSQLESNGIEVVEYNGIKSNPVVEDVDKASQIALAEGVDFIVAVGGGSVIDSSKIISLTVANNCSAWGIMKGEVRPKKALPIMAVLTLAATGTEMNMFAVLQNHETKEKIGFGHPLVYPKESYLDPAFTLSVPESYTAYGIADLIVHVLESYFGAGEAHLSDKFIYAIIQEAMEAGPELLLDLNDYTLRERIMWAATNALNGLTFYGKENGDWGVHDFGHNLSLLYDIPHGASLTIVLPAWLRIIARKTPERVIQLGKALFNTNNVEETILFVEDMFKKINCPVRLTQVGVSLDKKEEIVTQLNQKQAKGSNYEFTEEERAEMVSLMFS